MGAGVDAPTVASLAGVMGEGKPLAPLALVGRTRTSSCISSSRTASLLGAGVRLWLDPRAGLEGLFRMPLTDWGIIGSLVGTLTFAAWPSRLLFWKKLAIDFWVILD